MLCLLSCVDVLPLLMTKPPNVWVIVLLCSNYLLGKFFLSSLADSPIWIDILTKKKTFNFIKTVLTEVLRMIRVLYCGYRVVTSWRYRWAPSQWRLPSQARLLPPQPYRTTIPRVRRPRSSRRPSLPPHLSLLLISLGETLARLSKEPSPTLSSTRPTLSLILLSLKMRKGLRTRPS